MLYAAGDEALYAELLRDFSSSHRQDIPRMQTAMDRGDLKSARLIAHTLKSSAALIGAKPLSAAALVAETVLSGEHTLSGGEMDKLKMEFGALIAKLEQLPEVRSPEEADGSLRAPGEPAADTAFDRDRVIALTEKLIPMLNISSTAVFDLKGDIQEILAPAGEDCKKLLKMIDEFDFGEAAQALKKIAEKLED
jgi:HPt (histidine-containing phosphotransfer) domain-containing protein